MNYPFVSFSVDLSSSNITAEQKVWLGLTKHEKHANWKNLCARFTLKRRLLSKYVRLIKHNKKPRAIIGRPAAVDEIGLAELIQLYQINTTMTNLEMKDLILQKHQETLQRMHVTMPPLPLESNDNLCRKTISKYITLVKEMVDNSEHDNASVEVEDPSQA